MNSPELKEQLRFEVNGQSYMLSFNRDDGRWYLLTPSITGAVKAIPVINDDEAGSMPTVAIPVGDGGQAGIN
jgi:hypothetical protein